MSAQPPAGNLRQSPPDPGCSGPRPYPRYIGSGPYCYANCLAMMLSSRAPVPSAIEVLTGAPFGVRLLGGALLSFDPPGWDPDRGIDAAIGLLGWTCEVSSGGTAAEAIDRLAKATHCGPAMAGPLELGLLLHRPGSGKALKSDHFVVVTGVEDELVRFHDPDGYPHVTLPAADFAAAWVADTIGYQPEPFTLRAGFRQLTRVSLAEAVRRSLPAAVRWLTDGESACPPTSGGAAACLHLADIADTGLNVDQQEHLERFAVRVGARRLTDTATWLGQIGADRAAGIADGQARLAGAIQDPLVREDHKAVAMILRQLAPTYARLGQALSEYLQTAR